MRRDTALATAIAARMGLPVRPIRAVENMGSVNHVFVVGSGADRWVVRFAKDDVSPDVFEVEAWCARKAAESGIPTPAVFASGLLDEVPFGVQQFVASISPAHESGREVWSVLGQYARVINGIGPDGDAPVGLFSRFGRNQEQAWASHLSYNLDRLDGADPLLRAGVYTMREQRRIAASIRELSGMPWSFGLSHGDLSPRNLIITDATRPVLIDWGSASFGPVPWTDLLIVDRDARQRGSASTPDVTAFLEAYALDRASIWPTFEKFRTLQRLDLVRWAADQRPEQLTSAIDDLVSLL